VCRVTRGRYRRVDVALTRSARRSQPRRRRRGVGVPEWLRVPTDRFPPACFRVEFPERFFQVEFYADTDEGPQVTFCSRP
jgi:hypothetical protein